MNMKLNINMKTNIQKNMKLTLQMKNEHDITQIILMNSNQITNANCIEHEINDTIIQNK